MPFLPHIAQKDKVIVKIVMELEIDIDFLVHI